MKYPIGIQNFEDLRLNNYKYIDKTKYIYKLANEGKYYFLVVQDDLARAYLYPQ